MPRHRETIITLRPRQNGRHFADDIFKWIFLNENVWILLKISLKFVPQGPINNIQALVQIMAWRRPGDKPLSGPMMVKLPTHICVTRPQWVMQDQGGNTWQWISHVCYNTISQPRAKIQHDWSQFERESQDETKHQVLCYWPQYNWLMLSPTKKLANSMTMTAQLITKHFIAQRCERMTCRSDTACIV